MEAQNETASVVPTRKLSLFEIVERTLAVLGEIDAADGELTEETDAALTACGVELEAKGEGYAAVIRMLGEEAEACDRFIESYKKRAARKRRQAETLKTRLFEAMQATGIRKITAPTATLAIQKSPAAVRWLKPADELPDDAVRVERKPDTSAIKERLSSGERLEYAELSFGEHLRIR